MIEMIEKGHRRWCVLDYIDIYVYFLFIYILNNYLRTIFIRINRDYIYFFEIEIEQREMKIRNLTLNMIFHLYDRFEIY